GHLGHRLAVTAGTREEAAVRLRDVLAGTAGHHVRTGTADTSGPLVLDFGDAGDRTTSSAELPLWEPVFAASWQEARGAWDALNLDAEGVFEAVAAPYAYARMLLAWGAEPAELRGSGTGEYVAACVADVLPLRAVLALAAARVLDTPEARAAAEAELAATTTAVPSLTLVSDRNGLLTAETAHDPGYWRDLASEPRSGDSGTDIEPVLTVRFGEEPAARVALLPGDGDGDGPWTAAALLYAHGADLDWARIQPVGPAGRTDLPGYPFERASYWEEFGPPASVPAEAGDESAPAPTEGTRLALAGQEAVFTRTLTPDAPVLRDHKVFDEVVVPGAWHLAAALSALAGTGSARPEVRNVSFLAPLTLPGGGRRELQVVIDRQSGRLRTASRLPGDDTWLTHTEGATVLPVAPGTQEPDGIGTGPFPGEDDDRVPGPPEGDGWQLVEQDDLYRRFAAIGIGLGPEFRWLERAWIRGTEAVASLSPLGEGADGEPAALPPGLIDSCFQLLAATFLFDPDAEVTTGAWVPVSLDRAVRYAPLRGRSWARVRLSERGALNATGEVRLLDASGTGVLELR
ncbi:polyketide synthase dehydratase domain-containing protein, partial [Streptomyces sp. W16]|uniref:polyketide synthase family protein n=1 Tax=Streptomyces sp. W16 TaxID=3076631 RepID=UPI00295B52C2